MSRRVVLAVIVPTVANALEADPRLYGPPALEVLILGKQRQRTGLIDSIGLTTRRSELIEHHEPIDHLVRVFLLESIFFVLVITNPNFEMMSGEAMKAALALISGHC